MLIHLHAILFERKCEFQTLNMMSSQCGLYMHLFMLVGVVGLFHRIQETLPYLMSSWQHLTILYPHLLVVSQRWRWSPSMMMRNLFSEFSWNYDGVDKFTACSMLVRFWNHSTCYYWIKIVDHLTFVLKNEKCDVPSHLHNYPITCKSYHKGFESNLNTITL